MTMEVNGEPAPTEITAHTSHPYGIRVGVHIGREYEEDGGGVFRQVVLDSDGLEDEQGNDSNFEVLLSVADATAIRDHLTAAITLATNAPDPDREAAP